MALIMLAVEQHLTWVMPWWHSDGTHWGAFLQWWQLKGIVLCKGSILGRIAQRDAILSIIHPYLNRSVVTIILAGHLLRTMS